MKSFARFTFSFLILALLFSSDAISQNGAFPSAQGNNNNGMRSYEFRELSKKSTPYYIDYETAIEEYNNFEGTPYFKDRTILADLYLPNGGFTPNVKIKYDLFNNEIIAWQEGTEKIILDLSAYSKIVGKGKDESLVLKRNPLINQDKFYEVLLEKDGFTFFKENIKVIANHTSQMPGMQHKRNFENKVKYHVQKGDEVYEFKLNAKGLKSIPDFKGIDIDKELKKVGMKKLKRESHFVKFFEKIYDYLLK